jgi:nucleotide-binding universal stress UspA family protein
VSALATVRARPELAAWSIGPLEAWVDRHGPAAFDAAGGSYVYCSRTGKSFTRRTLVAVWRAYAWWADRAAVPFLSTADAAAQAGVSEATVHRVRRALEAAGLLVVDRTAAGRPQGRGQACTFALVLGSSTTAGRHLRAVDNPPPEGVAETPQEPVSRVPVCRGDTPSSSLGLLIGRPPLELAPVDNRAGLPAGAHQPSDGLTAVEKRTQGEVGGGRPLELLPAGVVPTRRRACARAEARGEPCKRCRACATSPWAARKAQERAQRHAEAAARVAAQVAERAGVRPAGAECPHGEPRGAWACPFCRREGSS